LEAFVSKVTLPLTELSGNEKTEKLVLAEQELPLAPALFVQSSSTSAIPIPVDLSSPEGDRRTPHQFFLLLWPRAEDGHSIVHTDAIEAE